MLDDIRIQGLGVIDDAQIELDPGFTVVTGETGAGKTMVVTGLSLLLGARADAGLVRTEASRAVVEGRLQVDPSGPVARRATEAGAELDEDGTLVLVRSVSGAGRSRAHAGGATIPVGLLAELGAELVALHGQSDQLQMLRPARQRDILDRYAGSAVAELLTAYKERYDRLAAIERQLGELTGRAREREQEADLLRFGLGEIEEVAPEAGEDTHLRAEEARLGHADALRSAATDAHLALAGDDDATAGTSDALSLLGAARKGLDATRAHDDDLAGLADRVGEAAALVADTAADLASYASGVDTDPARLQAVGERRLALSSLTRKYGDTVDEVLAWSRQAADRLAELDGADDRIESLTREREGQRGALAGLAADLSGQRASAAERLGAEVTAELGALAMPHATLGARVDQVEAGPDRDALKVGERTLAFGPYGVDEVELVLWPHAGAPARPLQRGASGGELSRIMLALEVVVAGADTVPTFVFDEVDAGVGGRAAVEVGRRLARLARTAQVVVVTHLPQVAAFADRHYGVRKSDDGTVTRSGLVRLDGEDRVDELASMLAGLDDSASARAHAEELLAAAAEDRQGTERP